MVLSSGDVEDVTPIPARPQRAAEACLSHSSPGEEETLGEPQVYEEDATPEGAITQVYVEEGAITQVYVEEGVTLSATLLKRAEGYTNLYSLEEEILALLLKTLIHRYLTRTCLLAAVEGATDTTQSVLMSYPLTTTGIPIGTEDVFNGYYGAVKDRRSLS
jgi:hypothetical protein